MLQSTYVNLNLNAHDQKILFAQNCFAVNDGSVEEALNKIQNKKQILQDRYKIDVYNQNSHFTVNVPDIPEGKIIFERFVIANPKDAPPGPKALIYPPRLVDEETIKSLPDDLKFQYMSEHAYNSGGYLNKSFGIKDSRQLYGGIWVTDKDGKKLLYVGTIMNVANDIANPIIKTPNSYGTPTSGTAPVQQPAVTAPIVHDYDGYGEDEPSPKKKKSPLTRREMKLLAQREIARQKIEDLKEKKNKYKGKATRRRTKLHAIRKGKPIPVTKRIKKVSKKKTKQD